MSRWFNGCRTPQSWLHSETSRNGRRSVTSRANPTVPYQILALWRPGNCQDKQFDCSRVWSVPTTTPGSWTPQGTASLPSRDLHPKTVCESDSGFLSVTSGPAKMWTATILWRPVLFTSDRVSVLNVWTFVDTISKLLSYALYKMLYI